MTAKPSFPTLPAARRSRSIRPAEPQQATASTGPIDLARLTAEPSRDYHGPAGAKHVGSHALNDFRFSPRFFYKKHVEKTIPDIDRPAYAIGRAAHTLILEGEAKLLDEFVIEGFPINPKTGQPYGRTSDKFNDWLATQGGRDVLMPDDLAMIGALNRAVKAHPTAADLLNTGLAERVARIDDYCGVRCQIRMDWITLREDGTVIIADLKTCDELRYFRADASRYGYHFQFAFYQEVCARFFGIDRTRIQFFIIAVEKHEPVAAGVWRVTQPCLDKARADNEVQLRALAACQAANNWPTGFEDVKLYDDFTA